MSLTKSYGNLIFTDHALDRIRLRSITQDSVAKVLAHPDETFPADDANDSIKFIRTLNDRVIQVIATYLNDQRKWLIISTWVRGEDDPVPLIWQLITLPLKLAAKLAAIIWAYIRKKN